MGVGAGAKAKAGARLGADVSKEELELCVQQACLLRGARRAIGGLDRVSPSHWALGGPSIGPWTHPPIGLWAARRRGPSAWHSQEPREPAPRCQASCEGKRARGQFQHGALTRPRKIFATNVPPGGSKRSSAGVYLGGRLGGAPGRHCRGPSGRSSVMLCSPEGRRAQAERGLCRGRPALLPLRHCQDGASASGHARAAWPQQLQGKAQRSDEQLRLDGSV